MANVVINDTNLTNIADAIREKNGLTDTYKPSEMAAAILAISSSGGGSSLEIPNPIQGNLNYFAAYGAWDWLLPQLPEGTIFSQDVVGSLEYAFYKTKVEDLSNLILLDIGGIDVMNCAFRDATNLKKLPEMRYCGQGLIRCSNMFDGSYRLKEIDKDFFRKKDQDGNVLDEFIFSPTATQIRLNSIFYNCKSLRELPDLPNTLAIYDNVSYGLGYAFASCSGLRKIKVPVSSNTLTKNIFSNAFDFCYSLEDLIFSTQNDGEWGSQDDGTYVMPIPYEVTWNKQVIDLTQAIGYGSNVAEMTQYAGHPYDSQITISTHNTYMEDYWTIDEKYCVFDVGSACRLIETLPITNGTNTIKLDSTTGYYPAKPVTPNSFNNYHASVSDLPDAAIAMAVERGWTISFV